MKNNERSSWNEYPDHYKLMSFEMHLSSDVRTTDRECYGLLDYIGDLGGLVEILKLFFGWFASRCSSLRMEGIITNRLFHISEDTKSLVDDIKKATTGKSNKLR